MPEAKNSESSDKKNLLTHKDRQRAGQNSQQHSESAVQPTNTFPLPSQARGIRNERLPMSLRQRMTQRISKNIGNYAVQRLIVDNRSDNTNHNTVQRGLLDDFVNWFSDLFSTDPQEVIENMDTGLEYAHTVVQAVAETTNDPTRRRRWEQLAERLSGLKRVSNGIVNVIEAVEIINQIEDFVEALNDIPDNISDDPEAAADAFGRLFAAAGELGGLLPNGPWSPYFEWLSNSRDFFTNMRSALDPSQRWESEFNEIEQQGAYTTERGIRPR